MNDSADAVATPALAANEPPRTNPIIRRSRRGRIAAGLAALTVLALAGIGLAIADKNAPVAPPLALDEDPTPTSVPGAPVWYDARGLHHGDDLEPTPVSLIRPADGWGALALVRSGAVYTEPSSGDVWFHPWDGEPRIVGHNSSVGPGGDPNGDTAAWFDRSQLVVYDTAAGREISRTPDLPAVFVKSGDHYTLGNGFLQVSAEHVVWAGVSDQYRYDLLTQTLSAVPGPTDVHDGVEISGSAAGLVLTVPGRPAERYPHLEPHARLSADGDHVLAVEGTDERHAASIVDTRTGEVWPVPRDAFPSITWSYDDIALIDTEGAVLACDAVRRTCERLHPSGPFLLPTN